MFTILGQNLINPFEISITILLKDLKIVKKNHFLNSELQNITH